MLLVAEFRQDTLNGNWVLLVPEREKYVRRESPRGTRASKTFRGLLQKRFALAGSKDQLEVHANLFPALKPWPAQASKPKNVAGAELSGHGMQVLITLASRRDFTDLSPEECSQVALQLQHVLSQYRADRRVKLVTLFRNQGYAAGASQEIPHYQCWALPLRSPASQQEQQWVRRQAGCPACQLVRAGTKFRVLRRGSALVLVRPAGRFLGELLIVPRRHVASCTELSVTECSDLYDAVQCGIRIIRAAYGTVPFNEIWQDWSQPMLHARVEILPRLSRPAGLEHGYNLYQNPSLPEGTARQFRVLAKRLKL